MPCGVLKGLPERHHIADYIVWFFGIIEIMLVSFEYTILLTPALGGVRKVMNRLNFISDFYLPSLQLVL